MRYFLFISYPDDHGECDCEEVFASKIEALARINQVASEPRKPKFRLIEGVELAVVPVEVVRRYEVKS